MVFLKKLRTRYRIFINSLLKSYYSASTQAQVLSDSLWAIRCNLHRSSHWLDVSRDTYFVYYLKYLIITFPTRFFFYLYPLSAPFQKFLTLIFMHFCLLLTHAVKYESRKGKKSILKITRVNKNFSETSTSNNNKFFKMRKCEFWNSWYKVSSHETARQVISQSLHS